MFRFSRADQPRLPTNRIGALLASALFATFATTAVYADDAERSPCVSSQTTTGTRIQSDKCKDENGQDDVIEVIMIGAVLEPGDKNEADSVDATPELPMMRADDANAGDGARR